MNEGLRDLGCPACKSLQKNKVTSCSKTTVNCLCPHSPLNQSSVSGWKDVYPLIMGDVSLRTSHSDTPGALLWILFTCSLHTITKPCRYFISSCKKHKTVEHKNFLEPRNFIHNHIRFVSPQKKLPWNMSLPVSSSKRWRPDGNCRAMWRVLHSASFPGMSSFKIK